MIVETTVTASAVKVTASTEPPWFFVARMVSPRFALRMATTLYCLSSSLLVIVFPFSFLFLMSVLYQIRRSVSSVPAWVDVVRASFELDNPLLDLLEPFIPFIHLVIEGETGFPVVNLLTAEALIASHEGLDTHVATSAVD